MPTVAGRAGLRGVSLHGARRRACRGRGRSLVGRRRQNVRAARGEGATARRRGGGGRGAGSDGSPRGCGRKDGAARDRLARRACGGGGRAPGDVAGARRVAEADHGNRMHPYYLGPTLAWLRRHEPGSLDLARLVLQSHAFVVMRLTGEAACDASTAMLSTPLYDPVVRAWSERGLRAVGIDPTLLPRLTRAEEVVGAVTRRAAEATGLREGTPVVAGGGDFAASALGAGASWRKARRCLMLGTAVNLLMPRGAPRFDARLINNHHVVCERWLSLGGTRSAARCWSGSAAPARKGRTGTRWRGRLPASRSAPPASSCSRTCSARGRPCGTKRPAGPSSASTSATAAHTCTARSSRESRSASVIASRSSRSRASVFARSSRATARGRSGAAAPGARRRDGDAGRVDAGERRDRRWSGQAGPPSALRREKGLPGTRPRARASATSRTRARARS